MEKNIHFRGSYVVRDIYLCTTSIIEAAMKIAFSSVEATTNNLSDLHCTLGLFPTKGYFMKLIDSLIQSKHT